MLGRFIVIHKLRKHEVKRQRDLSLLYHETAVLLGLFRISSYVAGICAYPIYKRTIFPVLVFVSIRHIKLPPYKRN